MFFMFLVFGCNCVLCAWVSGLVCLSLFNILYVWVLFYGVVFVGLFSYVFLCTYVFVGV